MMTEQGGDEEESRLRAQWMAERQAEERAFAQQRNGVLWGAWSPDRLVCCTCGEALVEAEHRERFLDIEEAFSHDTIVARAVAAYNLMSRKSVDIPDWINPMTEFWRDPQGLWAGLPPDEIIMMATAEDALGQYGEYGRVCDGPSHVFIRTCPHCNETDPMSLRTQFAEHGMKRVDPPHEFLEELRQEQLSRQNRARALQAYLLEKAPNLARLEREALLPRETPVRAGEACWKCGSSRTPDAKFCTKCGTRFPD